MASYVIGFFLGAYSGAVIRDEYYFPTQERIEHAITIFKKNEIDIKKASNYEDSPERPQSAAQAKDEKQ